jgi:glycosyltransferase involved in cell wall biosynthesis
MTAADTQRSHPIPDSQHPSRGDADKAPLRAVIVIPVYNHAATLRGVVTEALRVHDAVMVVDDGSTDDVAGALQGVEVPLLRHPRNLGKGAAILTAAREARRLFMTHMVTIDADGQHNPQDINRFLPWIRSHPDAVVVGRRDFDHADVPRANRFGREVSNFWLRLQTGRALGDAQSGFRVYPLWVLEGLKLHERRYTFEIEVLVKAAWAGIELIETDIPVYYPPGEERVSHFHLFRDNLRLTRLNARLTLRAMLPWPHRQLVNRPGKRFT